MNKTHNNVKTSKKTKKNYKSIHKSSLKSIKLQSIKLHKLHNETISNNTITYKSIFTNNKNINKDIVFLKKQSFDIFYSTKYKYPLLVRELLTKLTGFGATKIIRAEHEDPWDTDSNIPLKYNLTLKDYETYEYYGGSAGHNAPAGWHKYDMNDYKDTFKFTNITPQTYSLNGGYWNLLENLCKSLQHNKLLSNINIFTGSIPNIKNSLMYNAKLEETSINIPKFIFKIVCFNHTQYPNITFLDIFIFNNKFYKININKKNLNFINYVLPIKSYNWFENNTGINILKLLKYYNINNDNIKSFKNIINLNLLVNEKNHYIFYLLENYYISSLYDVSTLEDLYNNYTIFQSKAPLNLDDNKWISNIFCKVRNRLIRDKILYTHFKNLNQFDDFFTKLQNDLNTKFYMNKEKDLKYLEISQDDYLNNYYNIVLNKNKWNKLKK